MLVSCSSLCLPNINDPEKPGGAVPFGPEFAVHVLSAAKPPRQHRGQLQGQPSTQAAAGPHHLFTQASVHLQNTSLQRRRCGTFL